jgi:hypothetical protein
MRLRAEAEAARAVRMAQRDDHRSGGRPTKRRESRGDELGNQLFGDPSRHRQAPDRGDRSTSMPRRT